MAFAKKPTKKDVVAAALAKFQGKPHTAAELKARFDKSKPKSIYTGVEIEGLKVPRIPSGAFTFDMLTGGGIPRDRITVFHGAKSTSKTTFALRIAGSYQAMNPDKTVVFVDFEGTFDWEWAKDYIPDPDRFHVVKPDYGEEGIDMIKAYITEADDVGLLIIDSLASIEPTAVMDKDAADLLKIGSQVHLINRLIAMLTVRMSQIRKAGGTLTTIAINQVRANMNPRSPAPHTQPGGYKLEHAASMDIKFYPGKYTEIQGMAVKVTHRFMLDKSKVSVPKRAGDFTYYLTDIDGHKAGEMEEISTIVTYAKRAGIILREGNKWTIPLKKGDPLIFDTALPMMKHLQEDHKLLMAIKKATIKACIINPFMSADENGKSGEVRNE